MAGVTRSENKLRGCLHLDASKVVSLAFRVTDAEDLGRYDYSPRFCDFNWRNVR